MIIKISCFYIKRIIVCQYFNKNQTIQTIQKGSEKFHLFRKSQIKLIMTRVAKGCTKIQKRKFKKIPTKSQKN